METNNTALGLIVVGALLSLLREPMSKGYLWLYRRLRKQEPSPRLGPMFQMYLMLTGMMLTIGGLVWFLGAMRH
ncbi:MAG: hypothetical protein AB1439_07040 [candidate division FCPU426 bacterium]